MAALWNRTGHYIFVLWFLLFFFLAWSKPSQIGCLQHFQTWCSPSANLGCRSETCCTQLALNAGCKKIAKNSPSVHHRTTLSGRIFATKARIHNRKKNLLNSNICSTCRHNMLNFSPLMAEICWRVWGTPVNFSGFRFLAALLHYTLVVGVRQTLRHWTEGATYIRQGSHHVGYWPPF